MTLIDLPCTARELENALHAACDHHGAWDMRIMSDAISSGRSIQDTRITLALSEGSGESSPSPSSPTSSAPTDSAAMRKALEAARDLLLPQCNGGTAFAKACSSTVNKIVDALAAPPRNCDVGTAEGQYKRFMNMCNSKDVRQCAECGMRGFTPGCSRDRCFANWAQMPYTEGGAK